MNGEGRMGNGEGTYYLIGLVGAAILWIISVVIFLTVFSLEAFGADYYHYIDRAGRTTLSNIPPPAEVQKFKGSKVQKFEREDVSWEAVREAEKKQELFWLGLKIEELAGKIDRLAGEVREWRMANAERRRPERDGLTVIMGATQSVKVAPQVIVPAGTK